ncbi:hypothetical protein QNI16_04435 [Cytophagaceae bacterium YF14B1]|uniref:Uncharacterized protein n=1 Tax=Xanthocytophaga flava TaxID=3048013 RepID=A0AAE3QJD8_9BACT|nr:hypothetical protein [Xanthocytophaga flavus]MDJ1479721.1 hypothetical protein [Xanthocytophaga flavus]
MLQKILSFFNSNSNTATIRKTESEKKANTPDEKMSAWLSHPMEYGKPPVSTREIEKGFFQFPFMNNEKMPYSLIEYKMSNDSLPEIGFVSPISCWSFMNVFDFSKLDSTGLSDSMFPNHDTFSLKELTTAYLGKMVLTFRSALRIPDENKGNEKEIVQNIFGSKSSHSQILEATCLFGFIFYVSEIREDNGAHVYMTGVAVDGQYDVLGLFSAQKPIASVALLFSIGKFFNTAE